jgi:microcompartment protein CcmL/EutN
VAASVDGPVAVGVIEAEGFVALVDGAQVMVEAAAVTVAGMLSLGSGIVAVAITGPLAHVAEAIEAGRGAIAVGHGVPVSTAVFANPTPAVRAIARHLDEVL